MFWRFNYPDHIFILILLNSQVQESDKKLLILQKSYLYCINSGGSYQREDYNIFAWERIELKFGLLDSSIFF